jgi:hypothetical protein
MEVGRFDVPIIVTPREDPGNGFPELGSPCGTNRGQKDVSRLPDTFFGPDTFSPLSMVLTALNVLFPSSSLYSYQFPHHPYQGSAETGPEKHANTCPNHSLTFRTL